MVEWRLDKGLTPRYKNTGTSSSQRWIHFLLFLFFFFFFANAGGTGSCKDSRNSLGDGEG